MSREKMYLNFNDATIETQSIHQLLFLILYALIFNLLHFYCY